VAMVMQTEHRHFYPCDSLSLHSTFKPYKFFLVPVASLLNPVKLFRILAEDCFFIGLSKIFTAENVLDLDAT